MDKENFSMDKFLQITPANTGVQSDEDEPKTIADIIAIMERKEREQDKARAQEESTQAGRSFGEVVSDTASAVGKGALELGTELAKGIGRSAVITSKIGGDILEATTQAFMPKKYHRALENPLKGNYAEVKVDDVSYPEWQKKALKALQPVGEEDKPVISARAEGEALGFSGKYAAPAIGVLGSLVDIIPGTGGAKKAVTAGSLLEETIGGTKALMRVIRDTDTLDDAVKLISKYGVQGAEQSSELAMDIVRAKNADEIASTFTKLATAAGKTYEPTAAKVAAEAVTDVARSDKEVNRAIKTLMESAKKVAPAAEEPKLSARAEKYLARVDEVVQPSRAARAAEAVGGTAKAVRAITDDIAQATTQGAKIERTPRQFFGEISKAGAQGERRGLKWAQDAQKKASELIARFVPKEAQGEAYKLIGKGITKANVEDVAFKLGQLARKGEKILQYQKDAYKFAAGMLRGVERKAILSTVKKIDSVEKYQKFIKAVDVRSRAVEAARVAVVNSKERRALKDSIKSLGKQVRSAAKIHPSAKEEARKLIQMTKRLGGVDSMDNHTLRLLRDQLSQIVSEGRLKSKNIEQRIQATIQNGVKEVRKQDARLRMTGKKKGMGLMRYSSKIDDMGSGVRVALRKTWNRTRDLLINRGINNVTMMDVLIDKIDGGMKYGGAIMRTIKQPIDWAYQMKTRDYDRLVTPVTDIAKKYKLGSDSFNRVGLVMLRNQGGEAMRHLSKTFRGNLEYINSVTLTPPEKELMDAMYRAYGEVFPDLRKVFNDIHGKEIKKVEQNYSPIRRTDAYDTIDNSLDRMLSQFGEEMSKSAKKGSSLAESRTGGAGEVELDAMKIFTDYMDDATHLIHLSEPIKVAKGVLSDSRVLNAVGDEGADILDTWLKVQESGGKARGSIPVMDHLRQALSVGILGLRPTTILKQPLAMINAFGDVSKESLARGLTAAYVRGNDPLKDFIFSAKNFPEYWERAGGDILLKELMEADPTLIKRAQKMAMSPIQWFDQRTAAAVMFGKYLDELKAAGKTLDITKPADEAAAKKAMEFMRRTQVSAHVKDSGLAFSAGRMTNNRSLDKMILMFMQYPLSTATRYYHELVNLGIKGGDKALATRRAAQIATTIAASTVATLAIKSAIAAATDDDYDPEAAMGQVLMNEAMSFIPGASFVEGLMTDRPMTALGSTVGRTQEAIQWLRENPSMEELGRTAIAAGPLVGLPTGGISQFVPQRDQYKMEITATRKKKSGWDKGKKKKSSGWDKKTDKKKASGWK